MVLGLLNPVVKIASDIKRRSTLSGKAAGPISGRGLYVEERRLRTFKRAVPRVRYCVLF